jgi:hypothetical protein
MASRDADAHPGPWDGQLQAVASQNGYRLWLEISRAQLPGPLAPEFGFNILIYDHDPAQQPCRLAWSAWETVQGWPELWGRVLQK